MKPLIVLIIAFSISLFAIKFFEGIYDFPLSARIAMSAMLVLTSIGHFKFAKGMTMMLPLQIPYKLLIIYFTGILEIAAAAGLLIHSLCKITGIFLIVFFILILPANIYAAIKHVNIEKADYSGSGLQYLWFRISLQIFFIVWIFYFII